MQEQKQKVAKEQDKTHTEQSWVGNSQDAQDAKEEVKQERVITLRPLNMQDFKEAKNQVTLLLVSNQSSNIYFL